MSLSEKVRSAYKKVKHTILESSKDYEMLIGEVLTSRGILTEAQLKEALEIQSDRYLRYRQSDPLGMILVEQGWAKEADIISTINDYYQIRVNSLTDNIAELIEQKRDGQNQKG